MIKYRVCVDKDSDWFEYRDTFEEALQVMRDLFEEAGKVFYQGFTNWTSRSKNGNCSCQVKFIVVEDGQARLTTHGIMMMDTEYKAKQAKAKAEYAARYAELSNMDNKTIYDIVAKGRIDNPDYLKACRIMSERTRHQTNQLRRYLYDFEDYNWTC